MKEGKKKKPYCKPELNVEMFTPNEYIAACDTTPGYTTYNFECSAGSGVTHQSGWYGTTKYVWKVTTDSGQVLADKSSGLYGPCGSTHTVKVKDGDPLPFLTGYIDNVYTQQNENIRVLIWTGEHNDNVHCMPMTNGEHTAPSKNAS